MPSFGAEVVAFRERIGQHQAAFARTLGISVSYLNDIEHARRRPTPAICGKLAALDDGDAPERWHELGARTVGWDV